MPCSLKGFRLGALRFSRFAACSGAPSHRPSQGSGLRRFSKWDYSRDLRPTKWGLEVSLHSSNSDPLMSALGQKRTFSEVCAMSALPPKAAIRPKHQSFARLELLRLYRRAAEP